MAKRAKQESSESSENAEPQVNENVEETNQGATTEVDTVSEEKPADTKAPTMTKEEVEEAVKKADFTIQPEPVEDRPVGSEALMFAADTKVTPALIMKLREAEAKKLKERSAAVAAVAENKGPRIEERAGGRRKIRFN